MLRGRRVVNHLALRPSRRPQPSSSIHVASLSAMEVTRHNFTTALADVQAQLALPSCKYAAIDTEFTGLTPHDKTKEKLIDTLEERYNKVRQSGENFLITQFGLALVHVDADKTWLQCYNFYVFPRPYQNMDARFLCQASSIQFMSDHGFDFNKFIKDGIPYLTRRNEEYVRKSHARSVKNIGKAPPAKVNVSKPFDKEFLTETIAKIEAWLAADAEKELYIPSRNSFRRLLVFHAAKYGIKSSLADQIYTESQGDGVLLVRADKNERENRLKRKIDQMNQEVEDAVGFSKVIQLLADAKKPVIGHNCLLDFVYLYHQFCAPLPPTLTEFKAQLLTHFPVIYDTKHIALTCPAADSFESTSLSAVFEAMRDRLEPDVATFVGDSDPYRAALLKSDEKSMPCHEAGFDALMTAVAYLGLASAGANGWQLAPLPLVSAPDALAPYMNRINLMAFEQGAFLDIADPAQELNRDHVYVVTHASGLGTTKMEEVFPEASIARVFRENDREVYVFLSEPLEALPPVKDEAMTITPFPIFKETPAVAPEEPAPSSWCTIS
ncbi:Poly(A)-specific ribonuclease PARN-like protein [Achlya hypogyna]|uniref:Poly(A)-specific ribonuclease PARN-like protein n=1 Tax=Achlya hypogyna TaxID=1202772 RepID=A0A1V9Z312_ACHHY|nr:Poly(A)-specific ribonuclease PARN-like protein [Achlya hypogyna]